MRFNHALWLLLVLASFSQPSTYASYQPSVLPSSDGASALLHHNIELLHSKEQHDDTDTDCQLIPTTHCLPSVQLDLGVHTGSQQTNANANPARAPPR